MSSKFQRKAVRTLENGQDSKTHGFYLTLEKDSNKQNLSMFVNVTVDGLVEQYAEKYDISLEEAVMTFLKSGNLRIYPTGEQREIDIDAVEDLI